MICTIVAVLYPMYATFRALEDHSQVRDARAVAEVRDWLAYWVVYSASTIFDCIFYRILLWLPFYQIVRLAFIIWLFFPGTRGATTVYAWAIGPVLRRNRPHVDAAIAQSVAEFSDALGGGQLFSTLDRGTAEGGDLFRTPDREELVVQDLSKHAAMAPASQTISMGSGSGHVRKRARAASPKPPCHERSVAGESAFD